MELSQKEQYILSTELKFEEMTEDDQLQADLWNSLVRGKRELGSESQRAQRFSVRARDIRNGVASTIASVRPIEVESINSSINQNSSINDS